MARYYLVEKVGGSSLFLFDIVVFGAFFSLFPWIWFRYNWPFALITFFVFGYLFFYFYRRNRIMRYICAGISSILYGMLLFSTVPLAFGPREFEGTKHDIAVSLAVIGFIASLYFHIKEYRRYFKTESSSDSFSFNELKTNKLAVITLIASCISFAIILKWAVGYVKQLH